jgi:hypothetical protein
MEKIQVTKISHIENTYNNLDLCTMQVEFTHKGRKFTSQVVGSDKYLKSIKSKPILESRHADVLMTFRRTKA